VEHTDYRPLPLESLVTLARLLLPGDVPEGATTYDRIRQRTRSRAEPVSSTMLP